MNPAQFAEYREAVLLGLLFMVALSALWLAGRREVPDDYPYEPQDSLFTPAERFFLAVLRPLLAEAPLVVFGKVRLADIIRARGDLDKSAKARAFSKIGAKHVDFVICREPDLTVVGVIELDDLSHLRADRRERDAFVDAALAAAGIPILHVKTRRRYSSAQLKQQLAEAIGI